MDIIPNPRAISYRVELSGQEAVKLYWAIDDMVSRLDAGVSRRSEFPKLAILFELYDGLYHKGISP